MKTKTFHIARTMQYIEHAVVQAKDIEHVTKMLAKGGDHVLFDGGGVAEAVKIVVVNPSKKTLDG